MYGTKELSDILNTADTGPVESRLFGLPRIRGEQLTAMTPRKTGPWVFEFVVRVL